MRYYALLTGRRGKAQGGPRGGIGVGCRFNVVERVCIAMQVSQRTGPVM
jgi:hypothetical protein